MMLDNVQRPFRVNKPAIVWPLLLAGLLVLLACRPTAPSAAGRFITLSKPRPVPPAVLAEPAALPTATASPAPPTAAALPPAPAGEFQASRGAGVLSRLQTEPSGAPPTLASSGSPLPTPTAQPDIRSDSAPTLALAGTDFAAAVRSDPGLDFVKIGFHVGPGGDAAGLSTWMETLDRAGIPFFLKSVDHAGPLLEAQRLREKSGVPHVLVYRRSGGPFELPDYDLNPVQAAREHWQRHLAAFPPELDPAVIWLETVNEVDKERAGWLGLFALETGRFAVRDGYRWAAFGWSSGEPEIRSWAAPGMAAFLQFAAKHPEQIAIALHEYSYTTREMLNDYPHLVGRFQQLYWVADQMGIARPTVLITEFGWEYRDVPPPEAALGQLRQAAELYASYPQVLGAAIWYLGPGFGAIDQQTQRLIEPLTHLANGLYFSRPLEKPIDARFFK